MLVLFWGPGWRDSCYLRHVVLPAKAEAHRCIRAQQEGSDGPSILTLRGEKKDWVSQRKYGTWVLEALGRREKRGEYGSQGAPSWRAGVGVGVRPVSVCLTFIGQP